MEIDHIEFDLVEESQGDVICKRPVSLNTEIDMSQILKNNLILERISANSNLTKENIVYPEYTL